MMNQAPNFDMKNPREYPGYGNAPIPRDTVSTGQRMVKSFNGKVLFWAAVAILDTLSLFKNPLFASASNNQAEIRLLFVAGLLLGICESMAWRKRNKTNVAPLWRRIVPGIMTLAALIVVIHYLGNNHYILSLCQGGVVGIGAWYAVTTYRRNWARYS